MQLTKKRHRSIYENGNPYNIEKLTISFSHENDLTIFT